MIRILNLHVFTLIAFMALVPSAKAEEFSKEQKKMINEMIEAYIFENPETILESVEKYQINQERAAQEQAEKNLKERLDTLVSETTPSAGNSEGDITIVEFFDYNCGYCKKAFNELRQLLKQDDNVRVLFKEMPILSPASRETARWSLASHKQGKYFEYHAALMDHRGGKDKNTLKRIAKDVGLDVKQLEKDAKNTDIEKEIDENLQLAGEIGIRGTPAFVINDRLSRGYIPLSQIKSLIKDIRSQQNKSDG